MKVTTDQEFSDLLIDVERLTGHPLDVTQGGYLTLRMMVPTGSQIRAMKLNFKDAAGNFGGIGEVANNFPGHYDEWQTYVINLGNLLPEFRLWHGDTSPLPAVTHLSLNPYNADQAGDQAYYLNYVSLTPTRPDLPSDDRLLQPPAIDNDSYTFTFDHDDQGEDLNAMLAYRVFEASNQAFASNIGGNPTTAIRMRGQDHLNNIAFLPILSAMNGGRPVDFTRVRELFFDYYLEPGGDEFDGATLYITSDGWTNMLADTAAYTDFEAGEWNTVTLPLKDLNLEHIKGNPNLLSAVDEWRLNLNFREGRKNITMWLDNVGWR